MKAVSDCVLFRSEIFLYWCYTI